MFFHKFQKVSLNLFLNAPEFQSVGEETAP